MTECIVCLKFHTYPPENASNLPPLKHFSFPANKYGEQWRQILKAKYRNIKLIGNGKICALHFDNSDFHLEGRLKPTATPKIFGPPTQLYAKQNPGNILVEQTTDSKPSQARKLAIRQMVQELREHLDRIDCTDCHKCTDVVYGALRHLKEHNAKTIPQIKEVGRGRATTHKSQQALTIKVKNDGNGRIYQCPICTVELKYPEIVDHIRSHAGATVKNECGEPISLLDSDEESTPGETSSVILTKINFRAKRDGSATVYTCNTCNKTVVGDIVSHFVEHKLMSQQQTEQAMMDEVKEEMADPSSDEEIEEIPVENGHVESRC